MPPRNSRIRSFKKYDCNRAPREDDYLTVYDDKTRKAIDYYRQILDPSKSPQNEFYQAFEQYKSDMTARGLSPETTANSIIKSEEEEDPRYRDKEWYKLRAIGDPRGWAIDGDRCDGRNKYIGRRGPVEGIT